VKILHKHILIVADHELLCKVCGQVMEKIYQDDTPQTSDNFWAGLDKMMIPLSVQTKVGSRQHGFWVDHFDRKIINYYRIFDRLVNTCEKLGLPKTYANETMRILLKQNKHFWSYKGQLKILLQVIENTNDKRLERARKLVKKDLEKASGI
jgi:hypothetical protein